MSRIAYIGLSSPLCYDYNHQATKTISDTTSSPNPILDNPFAIMLLYDEIWFLTKSLCPENMRTLPYVKFIDEMNIVDDYSTIDISNDKPLTEKEALNKVKIYNEFASKIDPVYKKCVEVMHMKWGGYFDTHTHTLKIGKSQINASSTGLSQLWIDQTILAHLKNPNIELMTNSISSNWFENEIKSDHLEVTERLLKLKVPNYLTVNGPYHECIEKARNSKYLQDFRKWIVTEAHEAKKSTIDDFVKSVNTTLEKEKKENFLKYYDPITEYYALAETLVGLIPGAKYLVKLFGLSKLFNESSKKRTLRWQAFMVDLE